MRRIGCAALPYLVLISIGTSVMSTGKEHGEVSGPITGLGLPYKQNAAQGVYGEDTTGSDTTCIPTPIISCAEVHSTDSIIFNTMRQPAYPKRGDGEVLCHHFAAAQHGPSVVAPGQIAGVVLFPSLLSLNSASPVPALCCHR